jgi:cell fate regulator YaaT (PSP1 superfamily)
MAEITKTSSSISSKSSAGNEPERTLVEILVCGSNNVRCCFGYIENNLEISEGSYCIIETEKGRQLGRAMSLPFREKGVTAVRCRQKKLVKIVRLADETDIAKHEQRMQKEKEAYLLCREKAEEQEVRMKIVNVEYHPNENIFYCFYTAEQRIDCRELAKDLGFLLKAKVELRQIGARDEGSLLGGVGSCGHQLCCTVFSVDDLPSVSMKMAKAQNIALNPMRISGLCGRLMCCLAFEFEGYKDNIKPKKKAPVQDKKG